MARFFALQWHHDGIAPYMVFEGRSDHGDALILELQAWLADHRAVARPVEEMAHHSGLAERSLKRRFRNATGLRPLDYVQHLRIEHAKRLLEAGEQSIEDIAWQVGYEDPAFFRRLFRRLTSLAPGAYRRRYALPDFARTGTRETPVGP